MSDEEGVVNVVGPPSTLTAAPRTSTATIQEEAEEGSQEGGGRRRRGGGDECGEEEGDDDVPRVKKAHMAQPSRDGDGDGAATEEKEKEKAVNPAYHSQHEQEQEQEQEQGEEQVSCRKVGDDDKGDASEGGETASEQSEAERVAARKEEEEEKRRKVMGKLTELLLSGSAKKIAKAAPVFCKVIESDCVPERSSEFFDLLQHLEAQAKKWAQQQVLSAPLVDVYQAIFTAALKVRSAFSSHQQFSLDTWIVEHAVAHSFQTDDGFKFAKAAKVLCDSITALDTAFPKKSDIMSGKVTVGYIPSDEEKACRLKALAGAVQLMFAQRKKQWTKADMDHTFKLVSDRRLLFPTDLRAQLDDMYDVLKEMRSKSTLGVKRSAGRKGLFRTWAS